ncbi:MAG: hypothetical protein J7L43_02290 [Candidatus Aenigmarchaeota archaeon]|nr:hypothetical protein [Candidatus Aenigmarchaeota archaeon]
MDGHSDNNSRQIIQSLILNEVNKSLPTDELGQKLEKKVGSFQAQTLIEEERSGKQRLLDYPPLHDFFMSFKDIQEVETAVLASLNDFIETYSLESATLIQPSCKTGLDLRVLSKLNPKMNLIGYDEKKGMIRRARRKSPKKIVLNSYPLQEETENLQSDLLFVRTEFYTDGTVDDLIDRISTYSYFVKKGGWVVFSLEETNISDYLNDELLMSGLSFIYSEPIPVSANLGKISLNVYRLKNHIMPLNFSLPLPSDQITFEDIFSFFGMFSRELGMAFDNGIYPALTQFDLSSIQQYGFEHFNEPYTFILDPYPDKTLITLLVDSDSRDLEHLSHNLMARYIVYLNAKYGDFDSENHLTL